MTTTATVISTNRRTAGIANRAFAVPLRRSIAATTERSSERFARGAVSIAERSDVTSLVETASSRVLPVRDVLLLASLRETLAQYCDVHEDDDEFKALSCFLPGGQLYVWLGDSRADWKWWTVTLDDFGLPRPIMKRPITAKSIAEIDEVAGKLSRA